MMKDQIWVILNAIFFLIASQNSQDEMRNTLFNKK
jgi:hypothetical protein